MTERNIPRHIAIIMDGNGRWAKEKGLPRNEGHRRGTKALEKIISYADKIGVEHLTVYAFSTENWKRPQEEVEGLMKLFDRYLDKELKKVDKDNHRFNVIGDLYSNDIPSKLREKILLLQNKTKDKSGMYFHMAFNYGGRDEILRACKKIMKDVEEGKLKGDEMNEDLFSSYLDTINIPDPDLMIRTSGEIRTSNFLPWQLTYTEFYFTSCLWPDFTTKELDKAIDEFNSRKRRFGKSE
ncbi:MAG: isoprenyl transferase [Candidatus Cellulosilyticum pullistercoris]|uniref:Isoprenyl transferase n=1 Tax=Candidatus Cellulosilyticum pullistercoris TaxID=2838521 RepID=A0A9E2NMU9_9FIRM|nr:isoprenyl transferase [Candidatus Cellulosilyticum pullistercoris]